MKKKEPLCEKFIKGKIVFTRLKKPTFGAILAFLFAAAGA